MLTAEGCRARRSRLFDALPDRPDWVLIADPQHLAYFAGYFQSPFVFRSTNGGAILLLGSNGSSILVADNLLEEFARAAHVDEVVAPVWYRGQESAPQRETLLVDSTLRRLEKCPGTKFGFEAGATPLGLRLGLETARGSLAWLPVDSVIHRLKRSKDADELAVMRRSIAAGDAAQAAVMRDLRPGMTEREAFYLVQQAAQRFLDEEVQIYGDFVSGPRCEQVGGPPSNRRIEPGDLFLADFSVVVGGYRGDFANTFVVGGKPAAEQVRLYEACLEAIATAERMLKPGVACRDIDRAIRDSFAAKHLAETFTSHSGHGIGLGHPDPPYLTPASSDTLVAGDIVAVEPGQYVRGVAGMRYERNYLITETGYELLSKHELKLDPAA